MEIYINGEQIDITLEGERTVGDVLEELEKSLAEEHALIISLTIDGRRVEPSTLHEEAEKPLAETRKLDISSVSAGQIRGLLKDLGAALPELEKTMAEIPVLLQSGKKGEAYDAINALADAVDAFCRLSPYLPLFPEKFPPLKVDGKGADIFFSEFAPVLEELCDAMEKNDVVTIGDLAEYEIGPKISALARTIEGLP
jgi:hypothetical protein